MTSAAGARTVVLCIAVMMWAHQATGATVDLAWDPTLQNGIGYRVYWGTQSGVYPNSMNAGSQTAATITGLADRTQYFFVVRAFDAAGQLSGPSNEVSTVTPAPTAPPRNDWDFDGDGHVDLLWQHDTSRQAAVWYLGGTQGTALLSYAWLSGSMIGWSLAASADFNRDGVADLVWQHDTTRQVAVWYMTGAGGTTLLRWEWITSAGVPGWRVTATGDLDGDGLTDLVWQHDTTRQAVVWYLTGTQGHIQRAWAWLSSDGVAGWILVGLGDFDRDGVLDLVWQHETTRQVAVWYMSGAEGRTLRSWDWLVNANQPGWTVVGARDWNRDGTPDLIWLNESTRQVSLWYMGGPQGTTRVGQAWLAEGGVAGWRAVAR